MRRIAITGASGFVGAMLARRFEEAGWTVTRLSHSATGAGTVPFGLGDEVQPTIFRSRQVTAVSSPRRFRTAGAWGPHCGISIVTGPSQGRSA